MSLSRQIFRESALERLSSPEQLDQLLQVTSPKGWLSLIAIWLILGAVVAWSIFGSVPTLEEGRGILVTAGGLSQVVAPGAGRLTAITVTVGDQVAPDQVVGEIDKQDLKDQIADARSQLEELLGQQESLAEFDRREEELQARLARVETDRLNQEIDFATARLARLRERRTLISAEVEKGSMIKIDLDRVDEEIESARMTIEQSRLQIQQLEAKNANAAFQRQREALNRQLKIQDQQRTIQILTSRLEREGKVRSPFAGRVVEVRAAVQNTVAVGDPILLLETAGSPGDGPEGGPHRLRAVLYVSAHTGKRINRVGMDVELSPSTVKREEHGSLVGRVARVAPTPTSKSAMMTVLSDRDLVERLSQEIGLPLQVDVELVEDDSTVSGYRWTSAKGPPMRISAGTLCTGWVTVKRQSPISLVIPMLRRATGAD